MFGKNRNKNQLNCFSPPVMLATMLVELALLVWVWVKWGMKRPFGILLATLFCLLFFQFAEFNVCSGIGDSEIWTRWGYIAITFLPPIGIHLVSAISGKQNITWLALLYGLAVSFSVMFVLIPDILVEIRCTGQYLLLELEKPFSTIYYVYYQALLFAAILQAWMYRRKSSNKSTRSALLWMIVGYLSFLLPTGVIYIWRPDEIYGLPSIMCGFAIIYALIIAFAIAPLVKKTTTQKRKSKKSM